MDREVVSSILIGGLEMNSKNRLSLLRFSMVQALVMMGLAVGFVALFAAAIGLMILCGYALTSLCLTLNTLSHSIWPTIALVLFITFGVLSAMIYRTSRPQ
jgi:type III secretory pathway component EscS